jgi:ATP-dependent Zn protease
MTQQLCMTTSLCTAVVATGHALVAWKLPYADAVCKVPLDAIRLANTTH